MKAAIFNPALPNLLLRLWSHLNRRRRRQFGLLMCLMLVGAFAEVISLGAVLPFIGVLIAPDKVFSYPVVADIAQMWGITSTDKLVFPLTVVFAVVALLAGAVRILLFWGSTRLAYACGADLGIEVFRRSLYQPYWVHLSRNSSAVISGITNKVGNAVSVLLQLITLVSSIILIAAIMFALIVIDPIVASLAAIGFGSSYAMVAWISRRRLQRNSQSIAKKQIQVIKALQEGLGGIRDVLLDGTQPVFCHAYRKADLPLRRAQANNAFIGQSPRYIIETLGIVLIAALAYVLSYQPEGIVTVLPVLGALALGAQRLLPALHQSFSAWASIAGSYASLVDTIALLEQPLPAELFLPSPSSLPFQGSIIFDNVRFRYIKDDPWVLDGLTLTIPKGARIGFIGRTGSGKSTTLNLLMGLLIPTEGEILVGDQPIRGNVLRVWQRNIAHVPQSIFLADTTLAENIAFGVSRNVIDMDRVKKAALQAQIADFIETRPGGYSAFVGERGIHLSGGQRQRIGIARALYKQASVLVFDEATSALDSTTEQSVMDSIEGLNRDLTILLVSHRLTTLRRCDIIVELDHGRVVAKGTYEQLIRCSTGLQGLEKNHNIPVQSNQAATY